MPRFARTLAALALVATAVPVAIAAASTASAAPDAGPPSTPGAFRATATGPHTVVLSWSPSTDDTGVAFYHVDRVRPDGSLSAAANTLTATTFTLRRLVPDFEYAYRIVAVDGDGNFSTPSPVARVRTLAHQDSACDAASAATVGAGAVEGAIRLTNAGVWHDVYSVRFTVPAGQVVTRADRAFAQTGREVVLFHEGWSSGLPVGATTLRYTARHAGATGPATGARLNGRPC